MIALWLAACGGTAGERGAVAVEPVAIGLAECDVCGMVVREQPSPRGQVVYRGGEHVHVCSVEELRALATMPSAKGKPVALYVEGLPSSFDPSARATAPLPWIDAEQSWFVFGAERVA